MAIELIYCGGGNRRFFEIATQNGFRYGAQLPKTIYGQLYFADQDWKRPNRERYMAELKKHQPFMASVLDWEQPEQLSEVLGWAEEAAQHVQVVMIIPKVVGCIDQIPDMIGGRDVRLGYSVPTKFGGTAVPVWEFGNRPVHLLGGSPHTQMKMAHYLNVMSADGNMAMRQATHYCQYWAFERGSNGHWWSMKTQGQHDQVYEAFQRSCQNIARAWQGVQA